MAISYNSSPETAMNELRVMADEFLFDALIHPYLKFVNEKILGYYYDYQAAYNDSHNLIVFRLDNQLEIFTETAKPLPFGGQYGEGGIAAFIERWITWDKGSGLPTVREDVRSRYAHIHISPALNQYGRIATEVGALIREAHISLGS